MDNKGKSKANPHFDDDDDDLDLTLRLTLTPEPHDPSLPKEHDFMGLGGGSSGNKMHHGQAMGDTVGSFNYKGNAAGILVGSSMRPLAIRAPHQSTFEGGSLPWTGFATPSRKQPPNDLGKSCAACQTKDSPLWRRGSSGQTLCNKCGLRHSRSLKKGSK